MYIKLSTQHIFKPGQNVYLQNIPQATMCIKPNPSIYHTRPPYQLPNTLNHIILGHNVCLPSMLIIMQSHTVQLPNILKYHARS